MKDNKRTFKSIIIIILTSIMILGIIAVAIKSSDIYATEYKDSSGVIYTYTASSKNLKITGKGKATNIWKNKTELGDSLETTITSVTIGKEIPEIDVSAFEGCTALTKVTFSTGVTCTSIGNNAFKGCSALTNIVNVTTSNTLPKTITTIGDEAFSGCTSLKTVTFASGATCTSIGNSAFDGCTSLTTFTIPDEVTTIESGTFKGCTSLATLTIGTGVTTIGNGAFDDAPVTTKLTFNAINCTNYNNAFAGKQIKTVSIGGEVTVIPENFIKGNKAVKSIIIPSTVTNIKADAFNGSPLINGIIIQNRNCVIETSSTILKYTTVFVKIPANKNYSSFTGVNPSTGETFSTLLNWLYTNDKSYVPYATTARDTQKMNEVSQSNINTNGEKKKWISTLGDYGYKVGTNGGPSGTPRMWLFGESYGTTGRRYLSS